MKDKKSLILMLAAVSSSALVYKLSSDPVMEAEPKPYSRVTKPSRLFFKVRTKRQHQLNPKKLKHSSLEQDPFLPDEAALNCYKNHFNGRLLFSGERVYFFQTNASKETPDLEDPILSYRALPKKERTGLEETIFSSRELRYWRKLALLPGNVNRTEKVFSCLEKNVMSEEIAELDHVLDIDGTDYKRARRRVELKKEAIKRAKARLKNLPKPVYEIQMDIYYDTLQNSFDDLRRFDKYSLKEVIEYFEGEEQMDRIASIQNKTGNYEAGTSAALKYLEKGTSPLKIDAMKLVLFEAYCFLPKQRWRIVQELAARAGSQEEHDKVRLLESSVCADP